MLALSPVVSYAHGLRNVSLDPVVQAYAAVAAVLKEVPGTPSSQSQARRAYSREGCNWDAGVLAYAAERACAPGGKLHEAGLTFLGTGCFSVAFSLVLAGNVYCLKVSIPEFDLGRRYWDYCAEHPGAPYVPNVYARGLDPVTGWAVCLMDRLYDFKAENIEEERKLGLHGYVCADEHAKGVIEWARSLGRLDLHLGNVMRDAHGAAYIVDPIALSHVDRAELWS